VVICPRTAGAAQRTHPRCDAMASGTRMESILIELLVVLLVAGAIFMIARLAVPALGLPPVIVSIVGIVVTVVVIIWLVRLLPALTTLGPA
jgi:hypothetical protein